MHLGDEGWGRKGAFVFGKGMESKGMGRGFDWTEVWWGDDENVRWLFGGLCGEVVRQDVRPEPIKYRRSQP